jgi:broad specificity phosphatase PhoE
MAVEIIFETHALTTDNEASVATGGMHGWLSRRGRELAAELGVRRRKDEPAAIFCSDLGRAVETVEIGFRGSGIPVYLDPRLRECDYGDWNGMHVANLARQRNRRITKRFPRGECYLDVIERMTSFLTELHRDWDDHLVLVVGHSATRWALDHLLDGRPLEQLVDEPFDWREGWHYRLDGA